MKVVIQRDPIDTRITRSLNKELNTCNSWIREERDPPDDYNEKQELTHTGRWIHKFHNNVQVITLEMVYWIKEAAKIGKITGHFPKLFTEELDEYDQQFDKGYFIRTEHTSLKSGVNGIVPYTNMKSVIESIVTCTRTHQAMQPTDVLVNVYLMQWKTLISDSECRVFVYKNNITAIACQHWPDGNPHLDNLTDEELQEFALRLVDFFTTSISEKLDYTFDIALDDNRQFYFIEPNGFGADYPAGSSLFEWTRDDEILKGDGSNIVFRL